MDGVSTSRESPTTLRLMLCCVSAAVRRVSDIVRLAFVSRVEKPSYRRTHHTSYIITIILISAVIKVFHVYLPLRTVFAAVQ